MASRTEAKKSSLVVSSILCKRPQSFLADRPSGSKNRISSLIVFPPEPHVLQLRLACEHDGKCVAFLAHGFDQRLGFNSTRAWVRISRIVDKQRDGLLPLFDQIAYCLFAPLPLEGYPEVIRGFQIIKQCIDQAWESEAALVHRERLGYQDLAILGQRIAYAAEQGGLAGPDDAGDSNELSGSDFVSQLVHDRLRCLGLEIARVIEVLRESVIAFNVTSHVAP
jgi:hypothetical protein